MLSPIWGITTLVGMEYSDQAWIAAPWAACAATWKLDTRNCGTANATPAVSAAGQMPSIPRQPANAATTQNGHEHREERQLPAHHRRDLAARPGR